MKKTVSMAIAVLSVMVLTLVIASSAWAGQQKGFDGAWESIDLDGSYQVMVIQTSHPYFTYYDFGASVCGVDASGQPMYSFSLEGQPVIVGNELTVEGKGLCVAEIPYYWPENGNPQDLQFQFTYHRRNDTISDSWGGGTWSRIDKINR